MTADDSRQATGESAEWRELLTNGHRSVRLVRSVYRFVPGPPRCKLQQPSEGAYGAIRGHKPAVRTDIVSLRGKQDEFGVRILG